MKTSAKVLVGLLLGLLLGCAGCVSTPAPVAPVAVTVAAQKAASLRVTDVFDGGTCSATAVGPHTVLTAAHCLPDAGPWALTEKGKAEVNVVLLDVVLDGADHAFVRVDYTFTVWAKVDTASVPIGQGTQFHYWGNPLSLPDLYRQGYVMGECALSKCFSGLEQELGERRVALLAVVGQAGDSGSGILNERGDVIGVVSLLQHRMPAPFNPMGAIEFAFTPAQLTQVKTWDGTTH